MKPLGNRNTHFWLVQRMAQATETDLVAAMERAQLSQEDWAEMVQDCRSCDWTNGCKRWLDQRTDSTTEEVPEPCVNQARFQRLKKALEALE